MKIHFKWATPREAHRKLIFVFRLMNIKHRDIKNNFHLSNRQKDVLIGTLLGDGNLTKHGQNFRLFIKHSESQSVLAKWKRKEFDNLVSRIKECFENGNFSEAKEFFKRALAMHKEYGFPADEINEILQQIIIRENLIVLNELEKQSKDMFNFGYVRTRLRKIPNISVLAKKSARLKEESFKNEYLVCLYLAEQSAEQGLTGENNVINYYLGKIFLDNGIQCRKKYQVAAAYGKETLIAKKLNNLFFGTVDLKKNAFPEGLYEI